MGRRLIDLGYVKPNGDRDVARFAMDHRYPSSFVYDWLANRRTPLKDLERLARDLQTTRAYLLFGECAAVTAAGAIVDSPVVALPKRQAKVPRPAVPERKRKRA
jgi:hypothetical protein